MPFQGNGITCVQNYFKQCKKIFSSFFFPVVYEFFVALQNVLYINIFKHWMISACFSIIFKSINQSIQFPVAECFLRFYLCTKAQNK